VARRMRAAVLAGALFLTATAVSVPHEHEHHATESGHGQEPIVTIDGHDHKTTASHP
jgi:Spy/CpxP family protein refolding chaperone